MEQDGKSVPGSMARQVASTNGHDAAESARLSARDAGVDPLEFFRPAT